MTVPTIPVEGLRGDTLREAAPNYLTIINQVRQAVSQRLSPDGTWVAVEAIYPDSVVICKDCRTWSYPYTISGSAVSLGDPVEVVETFAPMREAAGEQSGVAWQAVLIQAGISENGIAYSPDLLRESAPRFDGARVYIRSDAEHRNGGQRDVRAMVGYVTAPRFVEAAGDIPAHIAATVRLPGLPDTTRALLVDAIESGQHDLVGLSIDARGRSRDRVDGRRKVREATAITQVDSVDLIVQPGAGGRLVRLVEAAPIHQQQQENTMTLRERMLIAIREAAPAAYARLNPDTATDAEIDAAFREAVAAPPAPLAATAAQVAGLDAAVRLIEARAQARAEIMASNLPGPARDRLAADFAGRAAIAPGDVATAIAAEREYLGRFVESGRVRVGDFADIQVEDRAERMGAMLDAFFDPAHAEHRNTQSFREAYVEITGDRRVTGRLSDCDMVRLRASLGADTFREATAPTASFAQVLGDSITRRMVAAYRIASVYDVWRAIATTVPISDFRPQKRVSWGGFGDLPVVAQGDPYADGAVPPEDGAEYSAAKRGRLSSVTLEAIRNDDVGVIRSIPTKLANAAKRTLGKFVLDLIRTNPVLADGKALFHVDHGNLGTAALSAASWSACRLAMMAQREPGTTDPMGIGPATLLVPPNLEEAAGDLFNQRGTNNDQSFIQRTAPTIAPVWYWTDANDWAAAAALGDISAIEVGFLDGNEEPDLFVQESPTMGSLFANDVITYKIRHVYGGTVIDYRGLYKAVVA